eukprot:gene20803-23627_t
MDFCKRVDSEIIISDAVQVYSHMDIGSNKPTKADREKVPHHLLDVCHPSTVMTTGDYYRKATASILDVLDRGKVPVVVGGSTMWVQWLVQGIPDAPVASQEISEQAEAMLKDLREAEQWDEGLSVLRKYDADKPDKLSRNDWYRLQRSLEIALQLSANATAAKGSSAGDATLESEENMTEKPLLRGVRTSLLPDDVDMRTIFITEDRETLYHTIDSRCVDMLELGHIREVAELLLNDTLQPEYVVAKSIGYRQTIAYLVQSALESEYKTNTLEEDTAAFIQYLADFSTATRNYAKRQLNWYRKDKNFLFVRSRRHFVTNKALADEKTAQEVQHWATVPREEFDHAVAQQVAISDALFELRQRHKVPASFVPDTHERRVALAWMVNHNEVKIPTEEELNYVPPPVDPNELSKSARKRIAKLQRLAYKKAARRSKGEAEEMSVDGSDVEGELEDASIANLLATNAEAVKTDADAGAGLEAPAEVAGDSPAPVVKREMPAWAVSIQDQSKGITPDLLKLWKSDLSAVVPDVRCTAVDVTHKSYRNKMITTRFHESYQPLIAQVVYWRARLLQDKRDVLVRFLEEFKKD